MAASRNLDILTIVTYPRHEERLPGRPTWAVDFTFGDRFAKIGANRNLPYAHPSKTQWNTGNIYSDAPGFHVHDGGLYVKVIQLDTILGIFRVAKREYRFPEQRSQNDVASLQRLMDTLSGKIPYKTRDHTKVPQSHPVDLKESHECWYCVLIAAQWNCVEALCQYSIVSDL